MFNQKSRIVPLAMPDFTLRQVKVVETDGYVHVAPSPPLDNFYTNHGAKAPYYPRKYSPTPDGRGGQSK